MLRSSLPLTQGVASLAISGYPVSAAKSRAASYEPGMTVAGLEKPSSRQTSNKEYLPAS